MQTAAEHGRPAPLPAVLTAGRWVLQLGAGITAGATVARACSTWQQGGGWWGEHGRLGEAEQASRLCFGRGI